VDAPDRAAWDTATTVSDVAEHFRATVHGKLDGERRELLTRAAGAGVARELRRALHLTDRAVRQWAARATAHERPRHRSAYEQLGALRPELGHALQRAANAEQQVGLDARRELIAQMVWGIGQRLSAIDAGAPPASLQVSLNHMAVEAGEILLAAGQVLGDPGWVLDEANETLRELVGVR
jgi:hypothetical protein